MAMLKAVYDAQTDVPEWARTQNLYAQRSDGKWEFKHSEVEGIAELSNPGLAANRDRFSREKEAAETRATEAERLRGEAERQLAAVRTPGSVILSADDAKAWQGFSSLGTLAQVKKMVEEHPDLKKKVELQGQESLWKEAAGDLRLNFDVLKDQLMSSRGEGVTITRKQVEVVDQQGQKSLAMRPFVVRREKVEGGGFKETETGLLEFATANWPAYLVAALQTSATSSEQGGEGQGGALDEEGAYGTGLLQPSYGAGGPTPAPVATGGGGGLKLPVLGSATPQQGNTRSAGALDPTKLANDFNAARNTRPNPLNPQANNAAATGKT